MKSITADTDGRLPHGGVDRNSHAQPAAQSTRESPPTRRRGSKHYHATRSQSRLPVASHTEAWIETRLGVRLCRRLPVASHTEAWIETPRRGSKCSCRLSPPTRRRGSKHRTAAQRHGSDRRLPHGGVDRNRMERLKAAQAERRLPHGGVDRNASGAGRWGKGRSGRLPHGGVDRNSMKFSAAPGGTCRLPHGGVDRNRAMMLFAASASCRLPHGGVDRNGSFLRMSLRYRRRLPHGGVDRNIRSPRLRPHGTRRLPHGGVDRNDVSMSPISNLVPSPPTRRRGSKRQSPCRIGGCRPGRLPHGGVDRNVGGLDVEAAAARRLPHGGVDRNSYSGVIP